MPAMLTEEDIRANCEVLKALAHPTRMAIVESLLEGEKAAGHLYALFDFDISTISKHLSVLKNAGLIRNRRQGARILYSVQDPCLGACLESVMHVSRVLRGTQARSRGRGGGR